MKRIWTSSSGNFVNVVSPFSQIANSKPINISFETRSFYFSSRTSSFSLQIQVKLYMWFYVPVNIIIEILEHYWE